MANLEELMENTSEEKLVDNAPDLEDGVFSDSNNEGKDVTDNTENSNDITDSDNTTSDEYSINDIDDTENTEEEVTEEEDNNVEENEDNNEPIVVNFGSGEIEVNGVDELKTIASKALKDKTKYDQYKDNIALLEGIKEQGLGEEDLYLLVEAKKGNKKAIAKLIKETGIDVYDLDPEDEEVDNYKPNEYKADMKLVETKAIIDSLKQDQESFTKFNNLITKDFDEQSKQQVFQDPTLLEFIGESIKSGLYEKIAPKYMKRKLLGESAITAFINAYDDFNKSLQNQEVNNIKQQSENNKVKASKRKKASAGVKNSVKSTTKKKVDFNNMSDEEFEEYYKNMVGF